MIMVVLFHSEILSGIWTQFHMPLFAFLSGMVYSDYNNESIEKLGRYIIKKIKGVYFPFVVYNIVFLFLHNFFVQINILSAVHNGIKYGAKEYFRQAFLIFTLGGGESLPGPMWYLIAMLEFTVTYAGIRWTIKKLKLERQEVVITGVCLVLMAFGYCSIDLPRMLNRALVLIAFYHVGFFIKGHQNIFLGQEFVLDLLSVVILLLGRMEGADWPVFSPIIIPASLAGIWAVLRTVTYLVSNTQKIKDWLCFIGQHTIFILGTQYLWFKLAILMYIKVHHLEISFLGTYGVPKDFPLHWKILCFVTGLGTPLLLVWVKEKLLKNEEKASIGGNIEL